MDDYSVIQMILAQIMGFAALALGIITYSQQDDARLKFWSVVQGSVLAIHFALLGAHVAAGSAVVSATRNYFSMRNAKKLVPLFLLCYATFGLSGHRVWYDLLPMLGSMTSTMGLFYLRGHKMRWTFVTSSFLWLIHNLLAASIGPAIMEAVLLCANLRTIYRLKKHKPASSPPFAAEI